MTKTVLCFGVKADGKEMKCIQRNASQLGVVIHTFNPSAQREVDVYELEASLVHILGSKPVRAA